ncbi:Abi family protein [Arabiibacter massiliensis]|uniref:Abi family protein n=1 Tax=Arabiibacter massiliensis TaxID=1870985 RepID=UPI0009BC72F5|nr:Abi family protein [Arabiibacter massiliensis]
MRYEKPWLSVEEQADLLIEKKGLICDRGRLVKHLEEVGYYRLSAYWFPYKTKNEKGEGIFRPGTDFAFVWRTYVFDKKLRLLMFDAVERIEVFVKNRIACLMAAAAGPFGYPDEDAPRLKNEYRKARRTEQFIKHFDVLYGDSHELPPYWMMMEVVSMGTVESLYSHIPVEARVAVADAFAVKVPVMKSWLSVARVARNACCHHSRVWNRIWGVAPAVPRNWTDFEADSHRTFAVLTVFNYMLSCIKPGHSWGLKVKALLEEYEDVPKEKLGFPSDWESMKAWSGGPLLPASR